MAGWSRCRDCRQPIYWGTSPYNPDKKAPFDDEDEEQVHWDTCPANEYVEDQWGERRRVTKCRTCGARVFWEETYSGARRPMDADDVYSCHFDTCAGEERRQESPFGNWWDEQPRAEPEPEPAPTNGHTVYGKRNPGSLADWYRELELVPPQSIDVITSSFRRLCMRHHPDMGGRAEDFIRIKWCFDRLKEYAR